MKKLLLIFAALIISVSSYQQNALIKATQEAELRDDSVKADTLFINGNLPILGWKYSSFGYHPNGNFDTVKAVIVFCDTNMVAVWRDTLGLDYNYKMYWNFGYVVREQYSYSGDRMPPYDYSPYWEVCGFLDSKKKKISSCVIIWDYKII